MGGADLLLASTPKRIATRERRGTPAPIGRVHRDQAGFALANLKGCSARSGFLLDAQLQFAYLSFENQEVIPKIDKMVLEVRVGFSLRLKTYTRHGALMAVCQCCDIYDPSIGRRH